MKGKTMSTIDADTAEKLAGLQIDTLQKYRNGHLTLKHWEWFNNLTKEERDTFVGEGGEESEEIQAAEPTPAAQFLPIPADNEEFELTLNGDATDPIAMVKGDGYGDSEKWQFNGPKVVGTQTGTFKLVRAGGANLAVVKEKLPKETPLAEGQWREAFKAKYPKHDGNGPIGFAGSAWVNPDGRLDFPCVHDDGNSDFHWTELGFRDRWRWLVRVK